MQYSLASTAGSPAESVEEARQSYRRDLNAAPEAAQLRTIAAGDEGTSWNQDGTFAGGHAAFVHRNLAVKIHIEGSDSADSADSNLRPMSQEDAQGDATRLAEAIANSLSETPPR
ncbi:hypothetical protein UA75_20580 [Actinoalloteichus sp. GBA129-24]|nr:hypothetical protein UA75_20580 [Actinoalloteichus sp. GBA129-24]